MSLRICHAAIDLLGVSVIVECGCNLIVLPPNPITKQYLNIRKRLFDMIMRITHTLLLLLSSEKKHALFCYVYQQIHLEYTEVNYIKDIPNLKIQT